MIIAVEGVDNCGKTTLINKLAREFSMDKMKFPCPNGLFYDELKTIIETGSQQSQKQKQLYFIMNIMSKLDELKKYRYNPNKHILLDRFLYSTIAYGAGKHQKKLFIPYKDFIEDVLKEFSPDYLVYIRKPRVYDLENTRRANPSAYDKNLEMQSMARGLFEKQVNGVMKYTDTLIIQYEYNSPDVMFYKVRDFLIANAKLKNTLH